MIIVRLLGGLGNQMFQYALGRTLALKNSDELNLDIEGYKSQARTNERSIRRFELDHFNIQAEVATVDEINRLKHPFGRASSVARKIRSRFAVPTVRFDAAVLRRTGNLYLEGYWQSEKYFKQFEDAIRADFKAKEEPSTPARHIMAEIKNAKDSRAIPVSLHVRRGDYAYSPESIRDFGMPPDDYYNSAVRFISERLNTPKLTLFVFSDDIVWVESRLRFSFPVTYVSRAGMDDWEEILLMSSCSHHIIANSTFSWWGAWLNNDSTKIVVAPKHWAHKNPWHFKDIIPADWIRI